VVFLWAFLFHFALFWAIFFFFLLICFACLFHFCFCETFCCSLFGVGFVVFCLLLLLKEREGKQEHKIGWVEELEEELHEKSFQLKKEIGMS
jgi:hypothetical protein